MTKVQRNDIIKVQRKEREVQQMYNKEAKTYQTIYTTLCKYNNEIEWTRFDYKQAWFSQILYHPQTGEPWRIFKSYNTIVAMVNIDNNLFIELGKWSQTTSKQVTQFYNRYYSTFDRILCK